MARATLESFSSKQSPGAGLALQKEPRHHHSQQDFCKGLLGSKTGALPEILVKTPTVMLKSGGSGQCYQPSSILGPPDKPVPLNLLSRTSTFPSFHSSLLLLLMRPNISINRCKTSVSLSVPCAGSIPLRAARVNS